MKQYEAVIQTIDKLGGIATLQQLNQEVFKIKEILNVSPQETAIAPNLTVKENIYLFEISPSI